MKIDIQRCIKVLSSFVVIFMVLLTAVAMPVFAVNDGLYNLSDMVSYRTVDDNVIKVHYMPAELGITPCIVTYLNGTVHDTEYADSVKFIFTSGSPAWAFYVSPLGVPANGSMTSGLVDVSDLREYSSFTLSANFRIDAGAVNSTGDLQFRFTLDAFYFDANLKYLGKEYGTSYMVLASPGDTAFIADFETMDVPTEFTLPENAVYVAPRIRCNIYSSGYDSQGTVEVDLQEFGFISTVDSVIDNSATMHAIKDQLGDIEDELENIDQSIKEGNEKLDAIEDDLDGINQSIDEGNEKLDTVIDGKQKWHDSVQDDSETQQEVDGELSDAMDSVDESTDLDNILPDNAQKSEDLEVYVEDWSSNESWRLIKKIFKPILEWGYIQNILMMIVAFINISVLLLGR